jgi:hypothetical protein
MIVMKLLLAVVLLMVGCAKPAADQALFLRVIQTLVLSLPAPDPRTR